MNRIGTSLIVCVTACAGETGPQGEPGENAVLDIRAARDNECPDGGGHVISVDGEDYPICDGNNGKPGAVGKQGPRGDAGPPGATGDRGGTADASTDTGIIESFTCGGGLDGLVIGYSWSYAVTRFGDGSAWVSASFGNETARASESRYYAPEQRGAESATVSLVRDIVNGTDTGVWTFASTAQATRIDVTYTDADLGDVADEHQNASGDQLSWAMTGAEAGCSSGDDPVCPANYCIGRGSCSIEDAAPSCACDEGYAGKTCSDCADGYIRSADGDCVDDICAAVSFDSVCTDPSACRSGESHCCWNQCGPEAVGRYTDRCEDGVRSQGECVFPPGEDYSCYEIDNPVDPSCPTDSPPRHGAACAVAECTPCNADGVIVDALGAEKVGWCVCTEDSTWSCATVGEWP